MFHIFSVRTLEFPEIFQKGFFPLGGQGLRAMSCTTHKAACGIETLLRVFHVLRHVVAPPTKPRAALKPQVCQGNTHQCVRCTTHKAACGIETSGVRTEGSAFAVAPPTKPRAALKPDLQVLITSGIVGCTTHKAACGMSVPIGSLRSPLTDLSEKQAHRAQLNGKQVVWENVPRTRVKRSVIGRR